MSTSSTSHEGAWIGIDLGTSNCACAVWDSTRGGAKWIRLESIAPVVNGKLGRTVPSVVFFNPNAFQKDGCYNTSSILEAVPNRAQHAYVGAAAMSHTEQLDETGESTASELIRSVKRIFGKHIDELDEDFVQDFPFELIQPKDSDFVSIAIHGEAFSPLEIAAILLMAIRVEATRYLKRNIRRKNLQIPSNSAAEVTVDNAVIGVPAHFSSHQRKLVEQAGHLAGFRGKIITMIESSAAALAYGLTFSSSAVGDRKQTICVVDIGGGTTDVTIARLESPANEREEPSYRVVVTEGDGKLGGDDMDQALARYCQQKLSAGSDISMSAYGQLKESCRAAKEEICGDAQNKPADTVTIRFEGESMTLDMHVLEQTLKPWIERAESLIQRAKDRLAAITDDAVDEVILVGGATRVPLVQQMLQKKFPSIELCTSLNPMGSVAQGLAIQAAFSSKLIPAHELKSALMLDCVPHAIGVQLPDGSFVELIGRNAVLPASGKASFSLASTGQPGITVQVVEKVLEGANKESSIVPVQDFNFLLRRLKASELAALTGGNRSVEVAIAIDTDGKVIVSFFDELDPEHVRKRERWQKDQDDVGQLSYMVDLVTAEIGFSSEQYLLLGLAIALVVLYIAAKIVFAERIREITGDDGSNIF